MRKVLAAGNVLAGMGMALAAESPLSYTDGKMDFPAGYRTWIHLSTGLDMAYSETAGAPHLFDNVYVDRAAYDAFRKSGAWPDGTVLVLETRAASDKNDLVKHGMFQSAALHSVETHVKDRGDWAFYVFGIGREPTKILPKIAGCYSCHQEHGVTDTTFTQFYPALTEN